MLRVERAGTFTLLVAAGATGAGIAIGAVAAAGGLSANDTTTTVREVASPPDVSTFSRPLRGLTIHDVYERAAPGVVQLTAASGTLGSGFVIDKAGHIVTSDGIVRGAGRIEVSFSDNEQLPARIVGRDPATGVAVLVVKAHSRALMPLTLGDSDTLQVGDAVVAIGNPDGEGRSITSGIVSALQRSWTDHMIHTDAALDTGGPLLDARGEVVGLGTSTGSAIPVNTVKNVTAQLIANGSAAHPYLGIEAQAITPTVARLFRLPTDAGLLVGSVCNTTTGLHGATRQVTLSGDTWRLGGDIVVKVDGAAVRSVAALRRTIAGKKPGETVRLDIYRGNATKTIDVKLGRQPITPRC
jgi:S1-C subfamily serine protease